MALQISLNPSTNKYIPICFSQNSKSMFSLNWAKSAAEKATVFAEPLEETFQPTPRQTIEEYTTNNERMDRKNLQKVTIREVREGIKNNVSAKKLQVSTGSLDVFLRNFLTLS